MRMLEIAMVLEIQAARLRSFVNNWLLRNCGWMVEFLG